MINMRTPLIAGNWKMNNNINDSLKLIKELNSLTSDINDNIGILVCPPFTALYAVKQALSNKKIKLGAQNMHYESSGAYTGEISPEMLRDLGVEYVIIGHSERRQFFFETDDTVNKKLKAASRYDIKPILCVGETPEQREKGEQEATVKRQIYNALNGISAEDAVKVIIAYEPIWAIGTGKNATSCQANEMATFIRNTFKELYSAEASQNVIIQYGGSVKADNAAEILIQSDIDGALVGGASLKADEFIKIIKGAML